MTKKEAAQLLSYIVACMPNLQGKNLEATATAWSLIMADIPMAIAKKALVRVLRDKKIATLPLPGEIIEACEEIACIDVEGNAKAPADYEAWQEVKQHLNSCNPKPWSHPAIAEAVKTIGSRTICEATYDISGHFMKTYNVIVKRLASKASNSAAIAIVNQVTQLVSARKVGEITQ